MGDTTGLRRKDTTKGPPLRILSLDGGGVRGYSIFIILQELMHRTFVEIHGRAPKPDEMPKPCDHFDLIGGSGTGGLIAIMLGRLRLDIDTCKDVYVRMTRRVFQTDKRIAGIPYSRTLFKASRLEDAIKDCVREHTVFDDEGNDKLATAVPMTPDMATPNTPTRDRIPQRTMSQSSRYSQIGQTPISSARTSINFGPLRFGNSNALLYDERENRTKTAVTAVFQSDRNAENTVLLRSYDSRKEPPPEQKCTIWEAGRATSAVGLAFKPIRIGQYTYHDDGSGKFNPAPIMLDEAVQNEYPGRDVGIFVSIGTGKRPNEHGSSDAQQQEWWEGFMGGSMGDFADARRRLITKIEACETTHQEMLQRHLAARGVPVDNYFRYNVEVGLGEFAMNEWNRLGDISTNTRMYFAREQVQSMNISAAGKLARVHNAKIRYARNESMQRLTSDAQASSGAAASGGWDPRWAGPGQPAVNQPTAFELPGSEAYANGPNAYGYAQVQHRPSIADQKYTVIADDHRPSVVDQKYTVVNEHRPSVVDQKYTVVHDEALPIRSHGAPPLPLKAPLPYPDDARRPPAHQRTQTPPKVPGQSLPYPDLDGPPPAVNTANKPYWQRPG